MLCAQHQHKTHSFYASVSESLLPPIPPAICINKQKHTRPEITNIVGLCALPSVHRNVQKRKWRAHPNKRQTILVRPLLQKRSEQSSIFGQGGEWQAHYAYTTMIQSDRRNQEKIQDDTTAVYLFTFRSCIVYGICFEDKHSVSEHMGAHTAIAAKREYCVST